MNRDEVLRALPFVGSALALSAVAALAVGEGAAQAATQTPTGNVGFLTGNNVATPVIVGANACGNGVGVLGAPGLGAPGLGSPCR